MPPFPAKATFCVRGKGFFSLSHSLSGAAAAEVNGLTDIIKKPDGVAQKEKGEAVTQFNSLSLSPLPFFLPLSLTHTHLS